MPEHPADPSGALETVRTIADLRQRIAAWRAVGEAVALVPTMGALHAGHLALVEAARARGGRVVATIFVNPAQFAPEEDFGSYPRTEREDAAKLAARGVDLLFAPPVEEVYPRGFATSVRVAGVSEGLCGASRPGHFEGVATVVAKLLNQSLPDAAFFGEKDYQQLQVIRRLAADLDVPVEIVGVPTVREADGLALSSRNAYLSVAERRVAPALYRVLTRLAAALADGHDDIDGIVAGGRAELGCAGFTSVEYLALRDAATLMPIGGLERPARLLAAVWLGPTRLIDNLPVAPPGTP